MSISELATQHLPDGIAGILYFWDRKVAKELFPITPGGNHAGVPELRNVL